MMTTAGRRRRATRPVTLAAMVLATGLAFSGCGQEPTADPTDDSTATPAEPTSSTTESTPPEAPTEPLCSDVWVAGQELPQNYRGCQDDEKQKWVEAFVYRCSSGQKLVTFRSNFYAAKGDVVTQTTKPLARDARFKQALAACGA